MNKTALFWLTVGIGAGALIFQTEISQAVQYDYAYPDREEIKEMIYAIPPTAAFSSIELNDTVFTTGDVIEADAYNRKLFIITDGSIIIERGVDGNP